MYQFRELYNQLRPSNCSYYLLYDSPRVAILYYGFFFNFVNRVAYLILVRLHTCMLDRLVGGFLIKWLVHIGIKIELKNPSPMLLNALTWRFFRQE